MQYHFLLRASAVVSHPVSRRRSSEAVNVVYIYLMTDLPPNIRLHALSPLPRTGPQSILPSRNNHRCRVLSVITMSAGWCIFILAFFLRAFPACSSAALDRPNIPPSPPINTTLVHEGAHDTSLGKLGVLSV